jgi:phage shock protein C
MPEFQSSSRSNLPVLIEEGKPKMRSNSFTLNKRDAKFMGVCAGLADWLGWDVTIVRVATVLGTILAWGGVAIAYIVIGLVARDQH